MPMSNLRDCGMTVENRGSGGSASTVPPKGVRLWKASPGPEADCGRCVAGSISLILLIAALIAFILDTIGVSSAST
jgi:hypothetical protein